MHWFAAPRLCFTAPKPCLAYFYKKSDPLTPVRSKHAFAPSIFAFFRESAWSYCARALLFCPQALLHRISLETRSAHACAVQTHFRPLLCGVFLKPFSAKCDALLRLGPALLRLRRTLLISARKALRSRLCNPNTLLLYSFCERLLSKCAALPRQGSALLPLSMLCRA